MIADFILNALLVILVIITVAIFGFLCFVMVDSAFVPQEQAVGVVADKHYDSAYSEVVMVYDSGTKTSLPQTIYHADDWRLTVKVLGHRGSTSVSRQLYETTAIGQEVTVSYGHGRITRSFYVKKISAKS